MVPWSPIQSMTFQRFSKWVDLRGASHRSPLGITSGGAETWEEQPPVCRESQQTLITFVGWIDMSESYLKLCLFVFRLNNHQNFEFSLVRAVTHRKKTKAKDIATCTERASSMNCCSDQINSPGPARSWDVSLAKTYQKMEKQKTNFGSTCSDTW